ncbi:RidA family protein [Roseisalinus antarcticus]|uniref:Putative reactive intermediate deaminase TdcF n=1 Tax=Roseisalinus antarcticus TaxID=254357 RepID=A0A1Y5TNY2_9RHOB|nr:RidA family protein [Roseisalinus antarcticus]SLN68476.1 Putative reactive intermediate deaminase TdcF [Roseisalinus antarcticus]
MLRKLTPAGVHPPFGKYVHGIEVPPEARLVMTSGQLGLAEDGDVPETAFDQAMLCLRSCGAILAEAGMGPRDVIRVSAYVTDRDYMAEYMRARDIWLADSGHEPASTLVIVSGFTRPEFLVEVEMTAAKFP